jgi:integrase
MEVFDYREVERLLDAARGTRLAVPVLLAVTTGLRRGELLGLRWQDVDLEAGKLAVLPSLEHTKAGLAFKQPKTQKGRRAVTLPPMAIDALRRRKADQAKERLLLGPAYADHGLVLARADGRPTPTRTSCRTCRRRQRARLNALLGRTGSHADP